MALRLFRDSGFMALVSAGLYFYFKKTGSL